MLYVSEANLYNELPDHMCHIEGYNLIKAKTTIGLGYSRIILLCKIGLQYKVENDRMEEDISSIWVKLGGRGRRGVRIGGVYREHTLVRQKEPNNFGKPHQQEYRWKKFIKQWVNASNDGNCVVIGDTNLDAQKWNNPDQGNENMINLMKNEITTRNFYQVITGPTRFWANATPSLIDQCWLNQPGKVSNIKNVTRGTADHNLISVTYRLSGTVTTNMVRKGRDRRNFDEEELKRRVRLTDWTQVLNEENPDIATYEFESKIVKILDEIAPIKVIQPRSKRCDWISQDTKRLMRERDSTRDRAVASNQMEEWNRYRKLKNECNTRVKTDRSTNLRKKYEDLEKKKDMAGLYKLAKSKMGWNKTGNPEFFMIDGRKVTNPKEMADLQVNHYHNKINKLIEELPGQTEDPTKVLKDTINRWGKINQVPWMELQPVGTDTILEILKEMKGSQSYGH